ncbi:TPA: hypothetical protein DEO28_02295 [Candidatus Dependentiae bacterium]|nr:MAG: Serine/threonine protein kinase with PASTA sensor(S) [candidate division TM6 bacterium GW2011_GWE2_31_21]KKP53224.1 MAG: Serine/threonine protein kinase with PASTA sensor(S) [candidate division TM6 bacterium GW2011_GWF2_33_332]HBS48077.1 hypothetical protein [Candidatus Dependentiae bacterium]HBZ73320.1 hypothetical protein [Candidatus Dependentiae bacterium]
MIRFKNLNGYIWFLPFVAFLLGYSGLRLLLHKKQISTPSVVGKSIQEALAILSENGLNMRLLKEVEGSDFKQGIVLEQQPAPGMFVQLNNSIFISIAKTHRTSTSPNFLGANISDVQSKLNELGIKYRLIASPSIYPKDSCFAQFPSPNERIESKEMILYISLGSNPVVIIPNFKNSKLSDIEDFAQKNDVSLNVVFKSEESRFEKEKLFVIDQKPMAGSIVDLSKKLYLQIMVDVQ